MNKLMNQSTQESLMKVVERAVRPLRAGKVRKLAMREELLPHLTALYCEEAARGTDEQSALAAAADRFGDPQELSQDLASTLTWRDRWSWRQESWAAAIDQTFGWQDGEPFLRFGQRSGSVLAALNVLFFVFVFVVARVANDQFDATFASFNRFTLALFAAMIASEVVVLWSSQSMYRALFPVGHPRRWLFAAASLVGWTVLMIVLGCIFWYGITLDSAAVVAVLPRIALATAVTLSPLVLLIAWAAAYERKVSEPYAQWSIIALDD